MTWRAAHHDVGQVPRTSVDRAESNGVTATAAIVALDESLDIPLYRQISDSFRRAITDGKLAPRTRLPSTRALAEELSVSRNTVSSAYDELWSEGYVEGKVGAGTFVTSLVLEERLQVLDVPEPANGPAESAPLSARGAHLAEGPFTRVDGQAGLARPFQPGVPALDQFPLEDWIRSEAHALKRVDRREVLGYGDPRGHAELRRAISEYLGATRGVRCEADHVIIMSGSQQGLELVARAVTDPDDLVWMEDPGRPGAHAAFRDAGATTIPIPVDGEGIIVGEGLKRAQDARLAYVSPSNQFPTAAPLSPSRRSQLLDWAREQDSWILEDTYDSEYRFGGRPLPALQGMDRAGRVIYVGSFSRVLFPALRLGYVVAPPPLAEALQSIRVRTDRHAPTCHQLALADFIRRGDFDRHVRRMSRTYSRRRKLVVNAIERQASEFLTVAPADAGMHIVAHLDPEIPDVDIENAAASQGIVVRALSHYSIDDSRQFNGLVLGHAVAPERQIPDAVQRLATIIRSLSPGRHGIDEISKREFEQTMTLRRDWACAKSP